MYIYITADSTVSAFFYIYIYIYANEVQYLTQIHLKLRTYHGKSCKTLDCGLFGIALNVGFQLIMIYPNKVQYQA